MTHPGMDTLLAHVDRELSPQDANAVAGHIASCGTCSLTVAGLRTTSGTLTAAVAAIDRAEPAPWNPSPVADAALLPLRPPPERTRAAARASLLPRAAGILLVIGAAASAAIMTGRDVLSRSSGEAVRVPTNQLSPAVTSVAVAPADGVVHVRLRRAAAGSRVYVELTEGSDAIVSAESTTAPHFTAADGRVVIDLAGSAAVIRVTLPRHLRAARVTAGAAVIIAFDGTRVLPAAASDSGVVIGGGMPMPDP